ncbi:hypothetical protein AYM40_07290 [Paraburkholderia phytofirmans OLGA172]|uniref:Uncharacterized protein n=1 Tax=Paraburkholderia phytofirmans OLGA172 TaxID=1417228 RepID=A0A160FJR2_9BURK|nr:hypothetical protein AYM40_07290 [Paraburkholderia phytofirmans OLGA172]
MTVGHIEILLLFEHQIRNLTIERGAQRREQKARYRLGAQPLAVGALATAPGGYLCHEFDNNAFRTSFLILKVYLPRL